MTEPYVLFDIGFNIGVTSLWWARNDFVKQIYGFEPFKSTLKNGEENLKRNPELAKKIQVFNFGLSDTDQELEFHYDPKHPRLMSTVNDKYNTNARLNVEKVQVRKASDVMKPLFEKHSEKKFLKINCEGSEFEILPDLDNAGLLKEVSGVIMEWHFRSPKPLIELFAKNGFMVHCDNAEYMGSGWIVAFKN